MSTLSCCNDFAIFIFFFVFIWKSFSLLYVHFIGHAFGKTPDLRKFGKWCVVTGCTSGIGKSYTIVFAKLGLNMVKVITADFAIVSDKLFKRIKDGLKGLDIGILVNNVGAVHQINKFCDIPNIESEIQRMINVNSMSHTMLTSMVLPKMAEKDRGLILYMSSISATEPSKQLQLYGSTKAYIDYFSRTLNEEYGSESLIIQSVLPGPVCSNIVRTTPSLFCPSSDDYVISQLKTIGLSSRTVGYFPHNLLIAFMFILNLMPKAISRKILDNFVERSRKVCNKD
ncbi:Very-long-chain 3-oxoacyl-CoA reductase [Nymphon striatum]|nr:Very-long-chain 3-oxoacyl-CoA reductase [Nymphon striatum]